MLDLRADGAVCYLFRHVFQSGWLAADGGLAVRDDQVELPL